MIILSNSVIATFSAKVTSNIDFPLLQNKTSTKMDIICWI